MYIALEGIDAAGKSTQIAQLKKEFPDAIFTFEPGATPLGKQIREILLHKQLSLSPQAEMLLFLADRAEHSAKILSQHRDKLIISDRSLVSGIAYAKDFDFKTLVSFNKFATGGILPDRVLLLELSAEELVLRLRNKNKDSIEQRGIDYLLSLQTRLKESIKSLKLESLILNASLPQAEITAKIVDFIRCAV